MQNLLKTHHDLLTKITTSIFVFFFSVGIIYGATTIGSSITTAGNLEVSGNATTTGRLVVGSRQIVLDPATSVYSLFTGITNSEVKNVYGQYIEVEGNGPEDGSNPISASVNGLFASSTSRFGVNYAVYGHSSVQTAYGDGDSFGVYGISETPPTHTLADSVGVSGQASGPGGNYGGRFVAVDASGRINYGVHAFAANGASNYAGYFEGNVSIAGSATTTGILNIGSEDIDATSTLKMKTSGTKGSCLVMKNSAGVTKYLAIEGDTLTVSGISCE